MSRVNVYEFSQYVLERAKEILKENGSLVPTSFVLTEGDIHVIEMWYENDYQQQKYIESLKEFVEHNDAYALVVVSEAYFVPTTLEDAQKVADSLKTLEDFENFPMSEESIAMKLFTANDKLESRIPFTRKDNEFHFGEVDPTFCINRFDYDPWPNRKGSMVV